jgi:flavin reductase (DIM6/NTAB) family NADH-FMN oxidoreductase RutF
MGQKHKEGLNMRTVKVSEIRKYPFHYPCNAAVLTTKHGKSENCMAISRHAWFSFVPPMYGVGMGTHKHSCGLVKGSREFVINWVPFEHVTIVAAAGSKSGKDVDKFKEFGIAKVDPLVVSVPVLRDAYAAYECKVVSEHVVGDSTWFAGEIVAVHYDETVFDDTLQMKKLHPVLWLSRELYAKAENPKICRVDRTKLTVEET